MKIINSLKKHTLLSALALCACATTAQAQIVLSTTQDGRVSDAGSVITGDNKGVRAGTNPGNTVFAGFTIFDISSVTETVTDGDLTLFLEDKIGDLSNLELIGVSESSDFSNGLLDDSTEALNFFGATGTLIESRASSAFTADTIVSWDVASFVEARRQAGDTYIAFRFQETSPSNGDSGLDQYQFLRTNDTFGSGNSIAANWPTLTLTTIPEPSTYAMLLTLPIVGLLIAKRRRQLK